MNKNTEESAFEVLDRREDFYRVSNRIYNYGLDAYELAVYQAICRFADWSTTKAYPGMRRLSEMINCTRPVIIKAIARLEELRIISVKRTSGGINVYHLLPLSVEDSGKLDLPGGKHSLLGGQPRLQGVVNDVDQNKNHVNENQLTICANAQDLQKQENKSVQMYDKPTIKKAKVYVPAEAYNCPLPYLSEAFRNAWISFLRDAEERKIVKTARAINTVLDRLAEVNDEGKAISALQATVANGWKGVFTK